MRPGLQLQLHRSLSFWSGLLVFAFIVWAWRDSTRCNTQWLSHHLEVRSVAQGLTVKSLGTLVMTGSSFRRDLTLKLPQTEMNPPMPPPFLLRGGGNTQIQLLSAFYAASTATGPMNYEKYQRIEMEFSPPQFWLVFVPYWLAMLLVFVPWVGLLLWRARRRRKQAVPNEA